MKIIELDAAKWRNRRIFYADLLNAVEAPDWHGKNINALIDSIIWGGINALEPPYTIRIRNLAQADAKAREELEGFLSYLPECKAEYLLAEGHTCEVFFEIE